MASFYDIVYRFHKDMDENGFSLMYEGTVNEEITKTFTFLADNKMTEAEENERVKKRVFHVMVECLQNICKHSQDEMEDDVTSGSGIFIVGTYKDEYRIITGNRIDNNRISEMEGVLEKINSLDADGLRQLYKDTMKNSAMGLSEKGGAGLGFIDIARKTGNKFEYHFKKVDKESSFFILNTKISRVK